MEIIRQPLGSNICGHCSIAMIAGETVETVIKLLGHEDPASTIDFSNAFREMEIGHVPQLKRMFKNSILPSRAILKVVYPKNDKSHMHWVAYDNGYIYDSSARRGGIFTLSELRHRYLVETKVDSYIEIVPAIKTGLII